MTLVFENSAVRDKPDDNRRPTGYCPFCDTAGLVGILRQEDDRIWLMNKYRTLRDTEQTVLIESADHEGDFSTYGHEQARAIVRFALSCWQEMERSGRYRSVLMYKNYGALSGGSLHHPHLQIVGLEHEDGYAGVSAENFRGIPVLERDGVEVTVSTAPIMGFFEVNIAMADDGRAPNVGGAGALGAFSDAIQGTVRHLLNEHHGGRCGSYNLFFYRMDGRIICKAMPRWVTSPYFVGYKISQVNSRERLEEDAVGLRAALERTL